MKSNLFGALVKLIKHRFRRTLGPVIQRDMDESDEAFLRENLNFSFMPAAQNIEMMSSFTARSREAFALKTRSLVLYLPDEAGTIKRLEEQAALGAIPKGFEPKSLNGLNIGCGDRRVNEHIIPVDIMRESNLGEQSGEHHAFLPDALLANPENLPFRPETIDFIIALHMLEHVSDPMSVLRHWGDLLKPGGGIGLILPNFEYTWDARGDVSQYGHKWNSNPSIFKELFQRHLSSNFLIETIDTLPHRISFDVVLRKPGAFKPFVISNKTSELSGAELSAKGMMASDLV